MYGKFIEIYGWKGIFRLIFYPITVLIINPLRLIQALWESRILLNGKWADYPHFSPHSAINSLFYWTAAYNISKYGRDGCSKTIGLGSYPLSRWFQYSLPSLYSYWHAGAVTVFLGMFSWWLAHFLWLQEVNFAWVLMVMVLVIFSTSFYSNCFAVQNYNVLGWIFVPVGLYSIINEFWILASLSWLMASLGSLTVVFLMSISAVILSISHSSFIPFLTIIPAILKVLTQFYWSFKKGNIILTLTNIAKAIGSSGKNVKYKRIRKFGVTRIYSLVTYVQFLIFFWWLTHTVPTLFLIAVFIFVINYRVRFADDQSIIMLILSTVTIYVIQFEDIFLLLSMWLVISPLPFFSQFPNIRVFDIVPIYKPFSIKSLLDEMDGFLKPVKSGEKVLMALSNPKQYDDIFDGYRVLLELPLYVSSKRNIHFIPDWWAVFETNYEGAIEFWGRDLKSVTENMNKLAANYVVVYQDSGTEIDCLWENNGFQIVSRFSWSEFIDDMNGTKPFSGNTPEWWLLRKCA